MILTTQSGLLVLIKFQDQNNRRTESFSFDLNSPFHTSGLLTSYLSYFLPTRTRSSNWHLEPPQGGDLMQHFSHHHASAPATHPCRTPLTLDAVMTLNSES